jgi:hypothetical protein
MVEEIQSYFLKKVWRRTRVYVEKLFSKNDEQIATI